MATGQVNSRIDADLQQVLEAAAWVEGKSVGELIRGPVEELARRLSNDRQVKLALQARAERAAVNEGKLTPISARRRSGGSDAS